MKKETHTELKQQIPNFDSVYTAVVPLTKVVYDKKKSQVRITGHATDKVPRYSQILTDRGAKGLPPVTVRKLPNGDFELKDGCTRALAAQESIGELWVSWYHDQVLTPTPDEWEDIQIQQNDHPLASPSSTDDIKAYICRQQASGSMNLKVGFIYHGNEEKYINKAIDFYRALLPNAGKARKWWKAAIENALKGHIARSYENYTKSQLFEMYCTLHSFAATKIGEVCNGEVAFPFRQPNEKNPHVIGSIAGKRMDNPGVKYTLIYAVGNLAGKNDASIQKERSDTIAWVKKVNKNYPGWINALYFAPQIKAGPNKENLYQLTKAII